MCFKKYFDYINVPHLPNIISNDLITQGELGLAMWNKFFLEIF